MEWNASISENIYGLLLYADACTLALLKLYICTGIKLDTTKNVGRLVV